MRKSPGRTTGQRGRIPRLGILHVKSPLRSEPLNERNGLVATVVRLRLGLASRVADPAAQALAFPTAIVEHRRQLVFLFLILAQGAHSVEEYVTRLYEVFAPAHFVSSLVSNDLALGFLVANGVLVTFGLWCWAVPVRSGWHAARGLIWFWTILELGNGTGHLALALSRAGYFPGVVTAPLLIVFALWLAILQNRQVGQPRGQ